MSAAPAAHGLEAYGCGDTICMCGGGIGVMGVIDVIGGGATAIGGGSPCPGPACIGTIACI